MRKNAEKTDVNFHRTGTLKGWAYVSLSPLQRLKGFFSGEEDLLSNVSAGTELPATAESARAYSPPDRSI